MKVDLRSYIPSLVLLGGLVLFGLGAAACIEGGAHTVPAAAALAGLGLCGWAVWSNRL